MAKERATLVCVCVCVHDHDEPNGLWGQKTDRCLMDDPMKDDRMELDQPWGQRTERCPIDDQSEPG